ncbi:MULTISPECIES: hypothetical protein [Pseudomonas]|uniref:Uncharacterized protein n=1 Tax=Pseudomonas fluorescens TaxID=294 RepID=A0A161Z9Y8_PSEFL|nr:MULTISPECIES: hypothetical protein [Pseudomonas]KZN20537.1 hypothetical protein A1D17_03070 [Pseudomonas fluorescens]
MTTTTPNPKAILGQTELDRSGAEFASFEVQTNGALLVVGDPAALLEYITPMMRPTKPHERGVLLRKADADLRRYIPVRMQPLGTGSRLEYFESGGVGVQGDFRGGYMGITETLAKLELFFTEDYGPEEFKRVFGKEATPQAVESHNEKQAVITARKARNESDAVANRLQYARTTGDLTKLSQGELETFKRERAAATAQWEAEANKHWMDSVGAGVVGNPLYQAFLDTVDDVVALAQSHSNGPYFAWHADRCREFANASRGNPAIDAKESRAAFEIFCREWATENLSARAAQKRASKCQSPEVTG